MIPSIILHNLHVARRCRIRPWETVLDVGSGQHPFIRANVLVDRFPFDDSERACQGKAVVDRPFFVADAGRLPFADKSFDVVICQHLLEHVADPGALLSELQRVGRRGYVETPARLYEKMYGNPFHAWYVSREGDSLVLEEKDRTHLDDEISTFLHRHVDTQTGFGRYLNRMQSELGFLVEYYWEGSIRWEVRSSTGTQPGKTVRASDEGTVIPEEWVPPARPLWPRLKGGLSRVLRFTADQRLDLSAVVRCPVDRARLVQRDRAWECTSCHTRYPIRGPLHVFEVPRRAPSSEQR